MSAAEHTRRTGGHKPRSPLFCRSFSLSHLKPLWLSRGPFPLSRSSHCGLFASSTDFLTSERALHPLPLYGAPNGHSRSAGLPQFLKPVGHTGQSPLPSTGKGQYCSSGSSSPLPVPQESGTHSLDLDPRPVHLQPGSDPRTALDCSLPLPKDFLLKTGHPKPRRMGLQHRLSPTPVTRNPKGQGHGDLDTHRATGHNAGSF